MRVAALPDLGGSGAKLLMVLVFAALQALVLYWGLPTPAVKP